MATKSIAWTTGDGNIIMTYQGDGDGDITVSSDKNNLGSARSQTVTIETTAGSPVVVKNFTIRQGACPVPVGTVLNYAYTGSYQEVELPAGQYKLQCWGAQGGSNAAASSYGITAKAGGKGGYSEGVLTLTSKTTVRIYVGGAGSSSAGGFNGGGATTGSASYNGGDTYGTSRMGGGGGATDIRLDSSYYSRMIVAGGGSGGAMCYQKITETVTVDKWTNVLSGSTSNGNWVFGVSIGQGVSIYEDATSVLNHPGEKFRITMSNPSQPIASIVLQLYNGTTWLTEPTVTGGNGGTITIPDKGQDRIRVWFRSTSTTESPKGSITIEQYSTEQQTVTTTNNNSQVGHVGGGTSGGGYSSTYQGKQNGAGSGGSFGQGANQGTTNYRYCSGAGGGGWYGGGGGQHSDSSMTTCRYSGGGSGWVNIAANASYRPSRYTGLQLDSGETKAGNTSFPSTSGGTETGHSGNGYARITRLS